MVNNSAPTELFAPPRLLILDLDERAASEYEQTLTGEGWQVDHARTFDEGLELAAHTPYNLAIMELMLADTPAIEGWNHLKELHPDMFGIITTSSDSLYHSVNAFEPGILAYLLKPLHADAINWYAGHVLEHQRLIRRTGCLHDQFEGLSELISGLAHELTPALDSLLSRLHALAPSDTLLLYLLEDEDSQCESRYVRWAASGQGAWTEARSRALEPLLAESVGSRRTILLNNEGGSDWDEGPQTMGNPLFGAICLVPLMSQDQVYGALAAVNWDTSERRFSVVDVEVLTIFSHALAQRFENERLAGRLSKQSIYSRGQSMHSPAYLHQLIKLQAAHKKRYDSNFSLILLEWTDLRPGPERRDSLGAQQVDELIIPLLQKHLRESDIVAQVSARQYAILLPATDGAAARQVGERLGRGFKEQVTVTSLNPQLKVTVSVVAPGSEAETLDHMTHAPRRSMPNSEARALDSIVEWVA